MKAISGYAEWFWVMAKNWKDCENRNWSLQRYFDAKDLPVRVYLHASKTHTPKEEIKFIEGILTPDQLTEFRNLEWDFYRGHIIGEITIVGLSKMALNHRVIHFFGETKKNSPWAFGDYIFWVKDGQLLDWPIQYRGTFGFFEVKL